ncbi:MAG: cupin domain-containing protein [Gammaproteobacteria bacterium]|jgi:mannose-6-phosphate isomerase-like protein (cupin superfamily)|nr:MAG: cupin domain-containing protein [Gammaproteobacteria bacterium]
MPNLIDPQKNYLLLETDGAAVTLPGGEAFWSQVMSGSPTDAGIKRLLAAPHGRLLTVLPMDRDWPNWERHPAGDEILYLISGELTLIFEIEGEERLLKLTAGRLAIVPKGVWHTAHMIQACLLLALTDGAGTEHRPA